MFDLLRRLSPRERNLVLAASIIISCALLYGLIVDPLVSRQRYYETRIQNTVNDLMEFRVLAAKYRETEASFKDLEEKISSSKSDSSLLSSIEGNARKLGLADRIASMKPFTNDLESGMVQTSVEIRIEKINLRELVDLLESVRQSGTVVRTGRLRIKTRFDDPKLLDATILVSAVEAG